MKVNKRVLEVGLTGAITDTVAEFPEKHPYLAFCMQTDGKLDLDYDSWTQRAGGYLQAVGDSQGDEVTVVLLQKDYFSDRRNEPDLMLLRKRSGSEVTLWAGRFDG